MQWGLIKNAYTGVVYMDEVYYPGHYYLGFWHEMLLFWSVVSTIEFSDESAEEGVRVLNRMQTRDKTGKLMHLDVTVQYRLIPEELGQLYRKMTINFEDVFISELRDSLCLVATQFSAADVWEQYDAFNTAMHEDCKRVLRPLHAECWGLQVWALGLNEKYENALIRTQVRKQAVYTQSHMLVSSQVRADTQILLASYHRNISVIKATGDRQKYIIERANISRAEAAVIMAITEGLAEAAELCRLEGHPMMNRSQLVKFYRAQSIRDRWDAQFAWNHPGLSTGLEPRELAAAQNIMLTNVAGEVEEFKDINEIPTVDIPDLMSSVLKDQAVNSIKVSERRLSEAGVPV